MQNFCKKSAVFSIVYAGSQFFIVSASPKISCISFISFIVKSRMIILPVIIFIICASLNSDLSISYSCSFICLKRTPRFFVVWHGKSSVEIILSELIIPFFDRFSRTKSVNKNTQSSFLNSACFCLHSQSADLDGFSKHPYENLPNASALMELMMRLELMTSSLPRMCATTCATSA